MNDFLNFSLNSLNLLDNKIHDNIKGTFVDNFIHELQDYLEFQTNDKILESLPDNTNLHFVKFEIKKYKNYYFIINLPFLYNKVSPFLAFLGTSSMGIFSDLLVFKFLQTAKSISISEIW